MPLVLNSVRGFFVFVSKNGKQIIDDKSLAKVLITARMHTFPSLMVFDIQKLMLWHVKKQKRKLPLLMANTVCCAPVSRGSPEKLETKVEG